MEQGLRLFLASWNHIQPPLGGRLGDYLVTRGSYLTKRHCTCSYFIEVVFALLNSAKGGREEGETTQMPVRG